MYDEILDLVKEIRSTLEAVGYAEDKLHFRGESIEEAFRLYEKYGEQNPELIEKVQKDARRKIDAAFKRYTDALTRSGE